jgi:hypothetical protein
VLIAGHGASAMSPYLATLTSRLGALDAATRRNAMHAAFIGVLHLAALVIMWRTEHDFASRAIFVCSWGLLNFFWLLLLRRPALSAALSLTMVVVIVLLSRLKYDMIWQTMTFLDFVIVDPDTVAFLLQMFPDLPRRVVIAALAIAPLMGLIWWLDPFRVRLRLALPGNVVCLAGLIGLSVAFPRDNWEMFIGHSYVSKFAQSGVEAIAELAEHGFMESDAVVADRLKSTADDTCQSQASAKRPHIILVHDESSFDIRMAPGIKVPAGYGGHFKSFDGKERQFLVEGAGGPSWYTEYNVLNGLSARSFGRFAYFVTRIASGRVQRGLPQALRRCGYRTFSLYPSLGAFMGARTYQATAGVQHFFDQTALGTSRIEPDSFFYDAALRMIQRERAEGPMFMFVYLGANHYPWKDRWRPDLMPEWRDLGNAPEVDEYLRRQTMSARDYAEFLGLLKREFPNEPFLLVRYGDHQPDFAANIVDPKLDDAAIAQRLQVFDPRYFTTYYAIDAVNYRPRNLSSAIDTLDAPYLPLVTQELAGLPLDASFAEQKRIMERCSGLFYACAGGAEARRFNRLLIDAGLIKGL